MPTRLWTTAPGGMRLKRTVIPAVSMDRRTAPPRKDQEAPQAASGRPVRTGILGVNRILEDDNVEPAVEFPADLAQMTRAHEAA